MIRIWTRIFLIVSTVALLTAIGVLIYGTIHLRNENISLSEEQFQELKETIHLSYSHVNSFSDPVIVKKILESSQINASLMGYAIRTEESGVELLFSRDSAYLATPSPLDDHSESENIFASRFFTQVLLEESLSIPGSDDVALVALFQVFSIQHLFPYIKISVIILIVLSIFLIAYVIFQHLLNKNENAGDFAMQDTGVHSESRITENSTAEAYTEEEPRVQQHDLPASGLFTPDTQIGWSSYLEERLSNELKRAVSFDQDLTLLLFTCSGPFSEARKLSISKEIVNFFPYRDLCFEYGQNGFAVIIPDTDIDGGITSANLFYVRLTKASESSSRCRISFGLSSRNGRIIDGNRLTTEAQHALEKAIADQDTNIVAFRSDPAKYRQYIATKTGKA